jgi:hypothetical protein
MSDAPLPSLVPAPYWVPLCIQGSHPNSPRNEYPSRSSCQLVPGGISSWRSGGMHPSDKGGDNSPSLQSRTPQEMCRSLLAETGTLEAISRRQCFIVPAQTQRTRVQRLSPENKGVSPSIPLQAGYRSKKQGLIHVWLYLISLATLP